MEAKMTDYISREAAKKAVCEGCNAEFGEDPCEPCDCAIMVGLEAIPAADVRPVVKAHWTDHRTNEHDGEWYCSNCGNEVTICMCGKDKTWDYPFCPNCGADMRPTSMSGANEEES